MRIAILCCILAAAAAAEAAPMTRDLGLGLVYYRTHELPEDLPPARDGKARACILDLRFARSDEGGATALAAWVNLNAAARAPVFILANTSTASVLLRPFAGREIAGLIVIGPAAPHFIPDLALHVTPEADRRSYDALEKGAPVESLLRDNPDKPRIDEALLEREHLSDADLADEAAAAKHSSPASPPPLIDTVLQGAVHLHRALVALKRL